MDARSILQFGLGVFAVLSALLGVWQLIVGWQFPLHRRRDPGRDRAGTPGRNPGANRPGITVLKPIKGMDESTEACLRSWFEQTYDGPRQMLIGVASLRDPVVPLVERLIAEYPDWHGRLVHCAEDAGINAKVSILIQLHPHVSQACVCVSDADVWAPADFLEEAMGHLADPAVGLVNSFYRLNGMSGLAGRWEALAVNADFWSQVLQSRSLRPLDFALGAAMVFRREALERSGGFRPLADLLADDFHLGQQLARCGFRIELLPVVVECRSGHVSCHWVWQHQLRWARTIRTCRPIPYFLSILSNATVWPVAWWLVSPTAWAGVLVFALVALRSGQALLLDRRLTGRWNWGSVWMSWAKDILQLVIWSLAFAGNRITWRGVSYRVNRFGQLTRKVCRRSLGRNQAAPAGTMRAPHCPVTTRSKSEL